MNMKMWNMCGYIKKIEMYGLDINYEKSIYFTTQINYFVI